MYLEAARSQLKATRLGFQRAVVRNIGGGHVMVSPDDAKPLLCFRHGWEWGAMQLPILRHAADILTHLHLPYGARSAVPGVLIESAGCHQSGSFLESRAPFLLLEDSHSMPN
jgi:hypothetical protein